MTRNAKTGFRFPRSSDWSPRPGDEYQIQSSLNDNLKQLAVEFILAFVAPYAVDSGCSLGIPSTMTAGLGSDSGSFGFRAASCTLRDNSRMVSTSLRWMDESEHVSFKFPEHEKLISPASPLCWLLEWVCLVDTSRGSRSWHSATST